MTSFYTEEELKSLGLKSCGENVKISRHASIYGAENISIGNHVRIDDFCILSGKITLGNYIHIAAATLLFGGRSGIRIADFSGLSSRCAIYAESDDFLGFAMANPTLPDEFRMVTGGEVVLEKHALIGTGCTILPKVTVHEGASVGAMSLISQDLEEWKLYSGNPCKKIANRRKNILDMEKKFWIHFRTDRIIQNVHV